MKKKKRFTNHIPYVLIYYDEEETRIEGRKNVVDGVVVVVVCSIVS